MLIKSLFLFTALAVSASADTNLRLVMVDGSVLRGTLLGNDAQVLTLEVNGKAKEIPIDGVRKAFDASTGLAYTFSFKPVATPVVQAPPSTQAPRVAVHVVAPIPVVLPPPRLLFRILFWPFMLLRGGHGR